MELQRLLTDLDNYKTLNVDFHAGDVYAHSVWSALFVNYMFEIGHKNVDGVDPKMKDVLVAAALLHDIGKGGDQVLIFFDKPNHPEIGGYYFDSGQYTCTDGSTINLRKVVSELGQEKNYNVIKFIVRNHWMIGGVNNDVPPSKLTWAIYEQFNLACQQAKIPYAQRQCLFEMLYIVWAADLMASQPFQHPIKDFPYQISNPPATHPGGNMYSVYKADEIYPHRQQILQIYEDGIVYPDFTQEIQLRRGSEALLGDKAYITYVSKGNPFLWEIMPLKKLDPKPSNSPVAQLYNVCSERMKDPLEIPLFAGFPTVLKGLNREQICRLYATIAASDGKYMYPFYYQIKEDFKTRDIQAGTNIYLGRGYKFCEPPNISDSRGLWAFLEKKYAYSYATGRDQEANYPTKGYCWNVFTYQTQKKLRLLNLSDKVVRDQVRKDMANFICESWYIPLGILDDVDTPTYSDAINYMFPRDQDPSREDRFSQTEVDIPVARALSQVYPTIDGWYIESESMDPEIVIFRPYSVVKIIAHEYFDANRLQELTDRCQKTQRDCEKTITGLFKKGKIICLFYPENIVKCYTPEEILDRTLVDEQAYQTIKGELDQGSVIIKIV